MATSKLTPFIILITDNVCEVSDLAVIKTLDLAVIPLVRIVTVVSPEGRIPSPIVAASTADEVATG